MLTITTTHPFDFRLLVLSHGWHDLPPFRWHEPAGLGARARSPRRAGKGTFQPANAERSSPLGELDAVIPTGGTPLAVTVRPVDRGEGATALRVRWTEGTVLTRSERAALRLRIRWMFRLDEDFRPFHAACRRRGSRWVAEFGLGAFLRNPSWFEEFTKILLTTNVNWAGTRVMARSLVTAYGVESTDPSRRAFPSAERLAGLSEAELRAIGRVGYRAPFLIELAAAVASKRLDLEALAADPSPTALLRKELKRVKGFGDYAVNALCLSFGRYDELIFDSWIRPMVARRHFAKSHVSDRTIRRFYAPWGEWKTLACWFDCAHETWLGAALSKSRRSRRSLCAARRAR